MTGRRRSSGVAAPSSFSSSSVLNKLQQLREFVPGFSESDYSSCLSQSSYNVNLAAERLMTGQFKTTSAAASTSVATGVSVSSGNVSASSSTTVPEISHSNAATTSATTCTTATTTNPATSATKKRPSPTDPSQMAPLAKKKPVPNVTPASERKSTTKTTNTTPSSATKAASATSTPKTTSNTPKPYLTTPKAAPKSKNRNSSNSNSNTIQKQSPIPEHALLLCERWLLGSSTTRGGKIDFQEPLEVSYSQPSTNNNINNSNRKPNVVTTVRFRGKNIQGTFARSLSAMLNPLLQYEQDPQLITLRAESLMDHRGIGMGAEVPLKLKVYITNPKAFFDLFYDDQDQSSSKNNKSNSSMFFGNKARKEGSGKIGKMTPAEAAFSFLQWAEYGDLQEIPDFSANSNKTTGLDDNDKKESATISSDDTDHDSTEEDIVMDEEDFAAEDVDEKDDNTPEWASSLKDGFNKTSLPEMEDPEGFDDAVVLRPYQRQALYWMMKREQEGGSREELEKELSLLSELASKENATDSSIASSNRIPPGVSQDIYCDCGSVKVSETAQKAATTFDGETSPLKHPLWQQRYLATRNMNNAVLFYVNELLGMATLRTPEPPQPCAGGILSDDMVRIVCRCLCIPL